MTSGASLVLVAPVYRTIIRFPTSRRGSKFAERSEHAQDVAPAHADTTTLVSIITLIHHSDRPRSRLRSTPALEVAPAFPRREAPVSRSSHSGAGLHREQAFRPVNQGEMAGSTTEPVRIMPVGGKNSPVIAAWHVVADRCACRNCPVAAQVILSVTRRHLSHNRQMMFVFLERRAADLRVNAAHVALVAATPILSPFVPPRTILTPMIGSEQSRPPRHAEAAHSLRRST